MKAAVVPVDALTGAIRLQRLPSLALYVHIPWCVRKCPYCDFNSHEWRGASGSLPEEDYVRALIADLESALPQVWGRRVRSIFFGGGTPSLFSAKSIDLLLSAFRARLALEADAEITLEANPGAVEAQKFRDFRAAGINRLSIGIQSFNPKHLKLLGRIHDDAQARRAVELARQAFDNFNIDIMYALPEQRLAEAGADVAAAIASGAPHVSAYHLTIEPNTWFHRHPPSLPEEDLAADIHELIESRLVEAGFDHYETSAYARPGSRCVHNLNYWCFGDYLGIGAGAHSKLSFLDRIAPADRREPDVQRGRAGERGARPVTTGMEADPHPLQTLAGGAAGRGVITRSMRTRLPRDYMARAVQGCAVQEEHVVGSEHVAFEFMMNSLRLTEGFLLETFTARTGLPFSAIAEALAQAEARGLIERDFERVRPTPLGGRFLNDLLELFLPRADRRGASETSAGPPAATLSGG